jgi:hypothetical protein
MEKERLAMELQMIDFVQTQLADLRQLYLQQQPTGTARPFLFVGGITDVTSGRFVLSALPAAVSSFRTTFKSSLHDGRSPVFRIRLLQRQFLFTAAADLLLLSHDPISSRCPSLFQR